MCKGTHKKLSTATCVNFIPYKCNCLNGASCTRERKYCPYAAVLVANLNPDRGGNVQVAKGVKGDVPVWGMVVVVCIVQPVELLSGLQ